MFGLLDRLNGKKRKEARAKKKELAGDLDAAVQLYVEAELPGEAARVLLLKADALSDPRDRMLMCAQAARVGEGSEQGKLAAKRKAVLGYDLIKAVKGTPMPGELLRAAADLEQVGEWERAAEAYRGLGDQEAEIRVLRDAGAIEELEDRLRESSEGARKERELAQLLGRIRDLDAVAERREALRSARAWLAHAHDEQIELEVNRILGKLVAGPAVTLSIHGAPVRLVLGAELTIGRARSDIVVASNAISRQHLRLFRQGGAPQVEDLDTRNGTMVAGARVRGAIAIGEGLELDLAGQVPCKLTPAKTPLESAILVEVAGESYIAPLGPLALGDWQIVDAHDGDERFVVLRTPAGKEPPHMGSYRLGFQVELCTGDEIRAARGGPVVLSVPDPARGAV